MMRIKVGMNVILMKMNMPKYVKTKLKDPLTKVGIEEQHNMLLSYLYMVRTFIIQIGTVMVITGHTA